jgi:hypothetical protein
MLRHRIHRREAQQSQEQPIPGTGIQGGIHPIELAGMTARCSDDRPRLTARAAARVCGQTFTRPDRLTLYPFCIS